MFNFTMAFLFLGSIIGVFSFCFGVAKVCQLIDDRFGAKVGWTTFFVIYFLTAFITGGLLL